MTSPDNGFKRWIFVTGPSGAGKTTVVNALEQIYGYTALKVGPYFRAKADADDCNDLKIAMAMRVPVPSHYIEQYIHEHAALEGQIFLIDGLPRTQEDIALIETVAPMCFFPTFVSLTIDFADSVNRLLTRRVCVECGNVGNCPVCGHCGCETVVRIDDASMNVDILRERYESMQSVLHVLARDHAVHVIDGVRAPEQVAEDVYGAIQDTTRSRCNHV